jgi:hypothetical protein
MKTDRTSLAFARVCFFVMLFLSTACNRMDSSRLGDNLSLATPAVAAGTQAAARPDADRMRELETRVATLESELRAEARSSESEGRNGVYYD